MKASNADSAAVAQKIADRNYTNNYFAQQAKIFNPFAGMSDESGGSVSYSNQSNDSNGGGQAKSVGRNGKDKNGTAKKGKDSHSAEVDKYGQIDAAFSSTTTIAMIGGVTYEFGIVKTDKGWYQYYESVYYTQRISLGWSGNATFISPKSGQHATFSGWQGYYAGMSLGGFNGSINIGTSTTYNTVGLGIGLGEWFSEMNGKSGSLSIGTTTLLGNPYRPDQIGQANFGKSFYATQNLGGQ